MGSSAARVLVLGAGIVAGLGIPATAFAAPDDPHPSPPDHAQAERSDEHTGDTTATSATPSTEAGGSASVAQSEHTDEGTHPPGNNGTVKVDGVPFDQHPDNEPHVGCTFQIDLYNYDEGDLQAIITFELHNPTDDGELTVSGDPLVLDIGDDPNGGGTDLDASGTYTLSFTGDPHPQQGHHVKLTVNAEGSQGADVKHKVFWVEGCVADVEEITTTTSSTSTTSSTTATTEVVGDTSDTTGVTEAVLSAGVEAAPAAPTEVLGVTVERAAPEQLARTGLGLAGLAALGAGLVLAGQAARRRSR